MYQLKLDHNQSLSRRPHCLMTPPAIRVPKATDFTFFSKLKSNRLGLLIFLYLHSHHLCTFFQEFTVILTKENFGYFIVNLLILKSLARMLSFSLIFSGISFTYFTAQTMKLSIKDSVNVTKSTGNCRFGHIY